ncbi:hypothetical protein [Desulfococcus sp.]|uniref:hypothetical protein n=1 Tax=Desulfococcus sp. TaxID=2025834 RepID=UPI003593F897
MASLRYALLADGNSDAALMPILTWALRESGLQIAINPMYPDRRSLKRASTLENRIRRTIRYYPCDVLFIHRDAEKAPIVMRLEEIRDAMNETGISVPFICVIPVRMQEAWLIFDESAIRKAAGNPNGIHPLPLPEINRVESIPDPKALLHDVLKTACGLSGRRLKKFNVRQAARRISEFIDDFSPLRNLTAFNVFEKELNQIVQEHFIEGMDASIPGRKIKSRSS